MNRNMARIWIVLGLVACAAGAAQGIVRFGVLGDSRVGGGSGTYEGYLTTNLNNALGFSCDFVVEVGDICDSGNAGQWDTHRSFVTGLIGSLPYWVGIGNHDNYSLLCRRFLLR